MGFQTYSYAIRTENHDDWPFGTKAMNSCPCGLLGGASGHWDFTAEQVIRYRSHISGPLLNRIDLGR